MKQRTLRNLLSGPGKTHQTDFIQIILLFTASALDALLKM